MRLLEGYSTLYTSFGVRVGRIRAKLVCLGVTSKQARVAPECCHGVQGWKWRCPLTLITLLLWNRPVVRTGWKNSYSPPPILLLMRKWTWLIFCLWLGGNMSNICPRKPWRLTNNVRSWQKKWECQLLVKEVPARGVQTSEYFVFLKICCKSFTWYFVTPLSSIVMWLHVPPVPRLRLPVSLLMQTRHV